MWLWATTKARSSPRPSARGRRPKSRRRSGGRMAAPRASRRTSASRRSGTASRHGGPGAGNRGCRAAAPSSPRGGVRLARQEEPLCLKQNKTPSYSSFPLRERISRHEGWLSQPPAALQVLEIPTAGCKSPLKAQPPGGAGGSCW